MINRSEIQYRVGSFGTKGSTPWATFLVYIDARTASRELDEKYDGKWSFSWSLVEGQKWAVKGALKVTKDQGLLLTYEDVGYPNDFKTNQKPDDTQWLKDAVSDALKRCAVQAGVARFLYDAPLLYTEEVETKRGRDGKEYFRRLTPMGEKMIEGNIDKWFSKIQKEQTL